MRVVTIQDYYKSKWNIVFYKYGTCGTPTIANDIILNSGISNFIYFKYYGYIKNGLLSACHNY